MMVKKALKFLHREFHGITEAALFLSAFTFLSQILAIVRDRMLASQIGTGQVLDVYYTAFRIPDLVFAIGGSLVSVTILIPFFVEHLERNRADAKKFINSVFTAFLLFIIVVSVLIFVLMPVLAPLVAPGFTPSALADLVSISRIMLLSPIILGVSNLLGTISQAFRRFVVFGLSPVFYNAGIIVGIGMLYPLLGIKGLAYGVVLGAALHLVIQLPVVIRQRFLPAITWNIDWSYMWKVTRISFPRTLTLALSTLTLLVLGAIASDISHGSVSIFNLSKNLQSVPLALIGISFSVAAFPTLVKYFSQNDHKNFVKFVIAPARQIIFWSLPVIALFVVLRAQIVRVILGAGEFSWADTRLTAAALALFSISVAAQSLMLLFVRGYYAAGRTWRPFTVNLISAGLTIGVALIFLHILEIAPVIQNSFERLMRVADVPGTEVLALPLAYSVGAIVNTGILWLLFKREFFPKTRSGVSKTFWQSFGASLVMGAIAYLGLLIFDDFFDLQTLTGIFMQGFLAGIMGLVSGGLLLYALRNEELATISHAIQHKFWRRSTTIPESQDLA